LVRECIKENLKVETLPGATAFVPALVNSGLPCDRFCFEGFLPVKKGRQTKFKELATLNCTFIIYESPHRLMKTLADFKTYFGVKVTVLFNPGSFTTILSVSYKSNIFMLVLSSSFLYLSFPKKL
jgi:16S rRNA (cytidine(1402)-2'-O)-methyltransferase